MYTTRDILRQTAGMVATEMGEGWSVDPGTPDTQRPTLLGPDGARVLFTGHGYGDDEKSTQKLELIALYPDGTLRDMYPSPESVRINVTRDRGPAVIAREITRRLLPKYLPELERAQAWKRKDAARKVEQERVAAELFELAGDRPGTHSPHTVYVKTDSGGTVRLTVREGGSVEVERLYLTPEQARRVLAALKG
jgi:hypothetical protein